MNLPQPHAPGRVLLLGQNEVRYGAFRYEMLPSRRVAASLSVGSDPTSPAMAHKGDPSVPNEDALLVWEADDRVLLAVADAHYGVFPSHHLLRSLADGLSEIPAAPMELARAVRETAIEGPPPTPGAASTLVVAVLRRDMDAGFGFSWGDSTCACVGGRHDGRPLGRPNDAYVNPAYPATLSPERASFFEFDVVRGELLMAFTDGVNECHYRRPETSIGAGHIRELFEAVGPDPGAFVRRLSQWALDGVDGNPGGQDNLALAVVAA